MKGFRCNNCGLDAEGEPKTVVQERADCSFGEVEVCPDCGSEDIDVGEFTLEDEEMSTPKERLEYLRGELEAERISYGELAELQLLVAHIEPDDVKLLEAAGVPECREITRVMPLLEACKELYRSRGYTKERDFPNEYYFMYNPQTGERVRLYYNGKAWEYR